MDIPDDIRKVAEALWVKALNDGTPDAATMIAEALMAERERKWRPIETAPKDGSRFLILLGRHGSDRPYGHAVVVGCWCVVESVPTNPQRTEYEDIYGWQIPPFGNLDMEYAPPTHWHPFPDPPIRTVSAQEQPNVSDCNPNETATAIGNSLIEGEKSMTNKCPRCGSTAPHMHPAVQHEGEVETCPHEFHLTPTPQNKPEYIAMVEAKRRTAIGNRRA